jgi:hypothetical protein
MADFVNIHKAVARRNSVSAFSSARNGGESWKKKEDQKLS